MIRLGKGGVWAYLFGNQEFLRGWNCVSSTCAPRAKTRVPNPNKKTHPQLILSPYAIMSYVNAFCKGARRKEL